MSKSPFPGFPKEGLSFLDDLAANNHKTWFEAHKKDYERLLRDPALEFIVALGERLKTISKGVHYDTRANGSGSLMRIYRDTRFSADKTPYKTNISMMFWEGEGKKMQHPGFGIQIQSHEAGMMAGMFGFDKTQLEAYRQAVIDNKLGKELVKAIEAVKSVNGFDVSGEQFKRVPAGYDADHPRANLLLYNGLHAYSPRIPPDVITSPEIVDVCFEYCRIMSPIQQWLAKVEGMAMT
jgi:uncharacterized protein (TIGR02453 family)